MAVESLLLLLLLLLLGNLISENKGREGERSVWSAWGHFQGDPVRLLAGKWKALLPSAVGPPRQCLSVCLLDNSFWKCPSRRPLSRSPTLLVATPARLGFPRRHGSGSVRFAPPPQLTQLRPKHCVITMQATSGREGRRRR